MCKFWLHESDKTRHFLDISVLFCPVHVEWKVAVKCLYGVAHKSLYTRRNILNIDGHINFKPPCKMGHFRENKGTIVATDGFLFIGPGTDCPYWIWHEIPPKLHIKQWNRIVSIRPRLFSPKSFAIHHLSVSQPLHSRSGHSAASATSLVLLAQISCSLYARQDGRERCFESWD